jgi:hypothetical protein
VCTVALQVVVVAVAAAETAFVEHAVVAVAAVGVVVVVVVVVAAAAAAVAIESFASPHIRSLHIGQIVRVEGVVARVLVQAAQIPMATVDYMSVVLGADPQLLQ